MIGFQFNNFFFARQVEITYLNCQIWGIGFLAVTVYSAPIYPTFLVYASENIGQLSLAEDTNQNCSTIRTISIPLQPITTSIFYYIEFTFGGSSVPPINWFHLAEIRFSDVAPIKILTTTIGEFTHNVFITNMVTVSKRIFYYNFAVESSAPTTVPITTTLRNTIACTSTTDYADTRVTT